jgi:hypothetical protein
LIRLGGEEDGGYLIPDIVSDLSLCFSPGVAERFTFEEDLYTKFGVKSHLCDNSVEFNSNLNFVSSFTKKHLGTVNSETRHTLSDWVIANSAGRTDLLLQMDIEGAEIPVILSCPQEILDQFKVIVIEIHFLEQVKNPSGFMLFELFFNKLNVTHVPVHLHINNNGGTFKFGNETIPRVIEITFQRKDTSADMKGFASLPHELDRPNRPKLPSISIPSAWSG